LSLDRDCGELVAKGIEAGILINVAAARVVRLLPAYILSDDDVDELVTRVTSIINEFLALPADAETA